MLAIVSKSERLKRMPAYFVPGRNVSFEHGQTARKGFDLTWPAPAVVKGVFRYRLICGKTCTNVLLSNISVHGLHEKKSRLSDRIEHFNTNLWNILTPDCLVGFGYSL